MNFVTRLMAGIIAVIAVANGVLVVGAGRALRQELEGEIGTTLAREARLVEQALPADSRTWQATVERLGREAGLRITLIATDGRVVAESDESAESVPRLENHANRPEVRAALTAGIGSDRRLSATVNRPLLYVAIRGGPGVVRVAAPLAAASQIVNHAQSSLIGAAGIALIIGALLAFLAARSVVRPLTEITEAARIIAGGGPPRFPRSGIPDIDRLVRSLREMHQQLEQRFTELRRERAESAALIEAMVEGVIATDTGGRIVTANEAARRLLGYGERDALPHLEQLFRAKPARESVVAVLGGESVLERAMDLDGRQILLAGRPLPQGGALLVLHDVTDLRRLETVRRDFVANVSHELKTPLTSISGYAETLVHDTPDTATTQRFLEVILANARRMQRLVDDLLDLSRIESGRWQPSPMDLDPADVGEEIRALVADRATARRVEFATVVSPRTGLLHADPDAMRQVLSNLVDNALRHTPPGGRISLIAEREGKGIAVRVRDTGSGIGREHLPRIFERFYRADPSRARKEGGTGLGLAIVKHLVEAHEGRVSATSEVGVGTEITCWFPDSVETES